MLPPAPPRLSTTTGWPSARHLLSYQAADDVGIAAGRERHDQPDRPVRIATLPRPRALPSP
jgi:hypothetical protein